MPRGWSERGKKEPPPSLCTSPLDYISSARREVRDQELRPRNAPRNFPALSLFGERILSPRSASLSSFSLPLQLNYGYPRMCSYIAVLRALSLRVRENAR